MSFEGVRIDHGATGDHSGYNRHQGWTDSHAHPAALDTYENRSLPARFIGGSMFDAIMNSLSKTGYVG